MKRLLLLLPLLLAAGYLALRHAESPDTGTAPATAKTLAFALPSDAPDPVKSAAAEFCARAEAFSGGSLAFELIIGGGLATDPDREDADLAFWEGGGEDSILALMSSPMLYRNHLHFTMAANAETLLGLLGRVLREQDVLPLGAYYGGARYLVATFPIGDSAALNSEVGEGIYALMIPGSQLAGTLEGYGIPVELESDPETRYKMADSLRSPITEFTSEELYQQNPSGAGLYCYQSMHNIQIYWLLISAEVHDSLDQAQRAALTEAAAYLYPLIDEHYLLRESFIKTRLREAGVTVLGVPEPLRAAALEPMKQALDDDPFARSLLEWVQSAYPAS